MARTDGKRETDKLCSSLMAFRHTENYPVIIVHILCGRGVNVAARIPLF